MSSVSPVTSNQVATLASGVTTNSTQDARYKVSQWSVFQATVVGTGAVAATITIECSLDNVYWCDTPLGTITLSGTTSHSDGFTTVAPWKYVRSVVSGISGTGATVTVLMGV